MRHWVTADYHLGHENIIRYCNRPFKSLEHMNESIIRNHNERVKPDDIVYHVGDFCFRNSAGGKKGEGIRVPSLEWEKKLNGKIIHLKGNHDKNNSTKTIIHGILVNFGATAIYMVHDPKFYNPNYKINFVGHVHHDWHTREEKESKLINVGVDMNRYMPLTIEEALNIA